jgi:hypothetical protein
MTEFMNATAKTATSSFALRSRLVESIGPPPGYSSVNLLRELSREELTRAIVILDEWVAANLVQAVGTDAPVPRMEAMIIAADRWALGNSWGYANWSPALSERLEHWRRISGQNEPLEKIRKNVRINRIKEALQDACSSAKPPYTVIPDE